MCTHTDGNRATAHTPGSSYNLQIHHWFMCIHGPRLRPGLVHLSILSLSTDPVCRGHPTSTSAVPFLPRTPSQPRSLEKHIVMHEQDSEQVFSALPSKGKQDIPGFAPNATIYKKTGSPGLCTCVDTEVGAERVLNWGFMCIT